MTIAISVKVNDGVVLAADSASTLMVRDASGATGVAAVFNNANKVFSLYKGLPIGGLAWGSGSIGRASISTLAKDLRHKLMNDDLGGPWKVDPSSYTMKDVAKKFADFMFKEEYLPAVDEWDKKHEAVMGFIVAGYSAGADMAEEYQIEIIKGKCSEPRLLRPKEEAGMTWGGEGEAIQRLVLGFGPRLGSVLQNNLGVPANQVKGALDAIRSQLQASVLHPAMPLQDVIDLAHFLVDTTVQFSRFTPGAATVGGPIELAAISKHEGFKWVRRKHYFSPDLNPREG